MTANLRTLQANLIHGVRTNTPAYIGGGEFSTKEQADIVATLARWESLLVRALDALQTSLDSPEIIEELNKELA